MPGSPTGRSSGPSDSPAAPDDRELRRIPLGPSLRRALGGTFLFVLVSLAFAGAAVGVELLFGHTLAAGRGGDPVRLVADAAWHFATGVVLALPTRRRGLVLALPLMTLGIDVDHLFGGLLPTVIGRESHSLLFLVVVVAVLYRVFGRDMALLGASATLLHLGVDGGGFPLLAPVTTAAWPLSFPVAVAAIVVAAALVGLAARRLAEMLRPDYLFWTVLSVAAVVVAGFVVPWVQVFNAA